MTENNAEDKDSKISDRATSRREARDSRRTKTRSVGLTRKPAALPKPVEASAQPEKPAAKPRVRVKRKSTPATRKKVTTAKPTTSKPATAKPATTRSSAKMKKPVQVKKSPNPTGGKRKPPRKSQVISEGDYDVISLPDGTQRRVKKDTRKKAGTKKPVQKKRSNNQKSGSDPAIVDLSTVSPGIWTSERTVNLGFTAFDTRQSYNYLTRYLKVRPKVAVILGTGLSEVASLVGEAPIEFSRIPGFAQTQTPGHPGQLRCGDVGGVPVLFCEGRKHFYETGSMKETVHAVRTFIALGAQYIILTTSAGAVGSYKAGDVMFVKDHVNQMGDNPLFGKNPSALPSVFVDVGQIYDKTIIGKAGKLCRAAGMKKRVGALAGVRGPVYETPMEKAWLKYMGVDAVCMSMIPEALACAHLGVPVTGLALIVNQASSAWKKQTISHKDVTTVAQEHAPGMKKLIGGILEQLAQQ